MNEKNCSERDHEHPLFRALVLMGGGLALSCGGSAVIDGNAAGSGGSRAVGGAPQGGSSVGGASAGGGGTSAVDAGTPDCPEAQWDCTALGSTICYADWSGQTRPEGCSCDPTRPKSVADCQPNESLFCLGVFGDSPNPLTWDRSRHVQCTCILVQTTPVDYSECYAECASTYSAVNGGEPYRAYCRQAEDQTCDPSGNNCTATPASVLRQDGVICGCASIVLK